MRRRVCSVNQGASGRTRSRASPTSCSRDAAIRRCPPHGGLSRRRAVADEARDESRSHASSHRRCSAPRRRQRPHWRSAWGSSRIALRRPRGGPRWATRRKEGSAFRAYQGRSARSSGRLTEERWDVLPGGESMELFAEAGSPRASTTLVARSGSGVSVAAFVHGGVIRGAVPAGNRQPSVQPSSRNDNTNNHAARGACRRLAAPAELQRHRAPRAQGRGPPSTSSCPSPDRPIGCARSSAAAGGA